MEILNGKEIGSISAEFPESKALHLCSAVQCAKLSFMI